MGAPCKAVQGTLSSSTSSLVKRGCVAGGPEPGGGRAGAFAAQAVTLFHDGVHVRVESRVIGEQECPPYLVGKRGDR